MMKEARSWLVCALVAHVAVLWPVVALGEQVVGETIATPVTVLVGTVTLVTVTSKIEERSLLPASVNLQRLDSAGRVAETLGTLVDDGTAGDVTAGDKTFTIQTKFHETTPGPVRLRVSAAFAGRLVRSYSVPFTITAVSPGSDVNAPAPGVLR